MTFRPLLGLILGVTMPLAVVAQEPLPRHPEAMGEDSGAYYGVSRIDDTVVGIAGALQARFDAGSVELTPALGPEAERNASFTMSLDSISRGSSPVRTWSTDDAAVAPKSGDSFALYDHGDGFVERYVARSDGFKQSFFFDEPIPGRGDLTVRLGIETELQGDRFENADRLEFTAPGLGGLYVGAVVGIDADGHRADGWLRYDGDHLDLVLPGDFVDTATYPLELDPLLGPTANIGVSFSDRNPDSTFTLVVNIPDITGYYLIVYEQVTSATDVDIWAQRVDSNGARVGNAIAIAANNYLSVNPCVSSNRQSGSFFMCWQHNESGNWDIRCRSMNSLSGGLSPITDLASGAGDQTNPDCANDLTLYPTGTSFNALTTAVWSDSNIGIRFALVRSNENPPGVLADGTLIPIPGYDSPTISKTFGGTGFYVVVSRANPSTLVAQSMIFDGANVTISNPVVAVSDSQRSMARPEVDTDGDGFTIVWDAQASGSSVRDVFMAHGTGSSTLLSGGGIVMTGGTNPVPLAVNPSVDQHSPKIALAGEPPARANDSRKYVATWTDGPNVAISNLELTSANRCGSQTTINFPGAIVDDSCVATTQGSNVAGTGALIVRRRTNSAGNTNLLALPYATFAGSDAVAVPNAPGCGAGGRIAQMNPFSPGNYGFSISLLGADPTSTIAALFLNVSGGPLNPGCGLQCNFLTPDIDFGVAITNGEANFTLPVPCSPANLGFTLNAQWAVVSNAAGGCSLLPQLHFSSAGRWVLAD